MKQKTHKLEDSGVEIILSHLLFDVILPRVFSVKKPAMIQVPYRTTPS
jgi:hypothetical protein